ncbi:branched-chain amino acid ABC transporter permease/ATP-binding protein [Arthrobacter sp. W4I7]|uniref:branched-chain amino acid ABC transporter permease/ATP-binding protein n=1 Tax=Arthrobacter sp. W4I7 TaxID=3042296 RepID=UPI00278A7780|nr:branched-chain amino acid ABC transporter permease/ATP-binding protein [Arthrobacter sp. W4I7]MDQ0691410.1 ABC-type branched-subunit amino acid transport system ATPase component/ABC-type branched-subunit amino acid transport system permease subunit [Arthrobacter sp. W4I7]
MSELISFALLGLGAAGVYTLLAQGVVVIFRGSGILNFALGAYAMLGSYLFVELQDNGLGMVPAVIATVLAVATLGALTYLIVMRPLRNSAPITKVITTLGLMILINAGVTIWSGGAVRAYLMPVLPRTPVELLGTTMSGDRLYLFSVSVAVSLLLWALYRLTPFGLATTASAENPIAASTLGWSPDLIATANWAIGTGLAALGGILFLPIFGSLDVTRLSFIIIYALAVALIGQFRSFPLVLLGGLLVGLVESLVSRYVDAEIQGSSVTVPLVIIVLVLVFRGRALPDRSASAQRLPVLGTGRLSWGGTAVAAAIALSLVSFVFDDSWNAALIITFASAIIMLSLVLLTGYSGQLSLGQFAIAGFGGFVAARLVRDVGLPFELAFAAGVVAAVALGIVFALTSLRTRGLNLAVVTLALGVACQNILFNNHEYSGGTEGIVVGGQTLFGISIDPAQHVARYATLAVVAFVLCAVVVTNLRRSTLGRRLIAVRTNERAAAALGINLASTKLFAFAASSAIAAVGGILLAFQTTTAQFIGFTPQQSINAVAFAIVGGLGFTVGPIFGAFFLAGGIGTLVGDGIVHALGFDPNLTTQYVTLIGGLVVIATIIAQPDGIAPDLASKLRPLLARLRKGTGRVPALNAVGPVERVDPHVLRVDDLQVRFGGVVAVDGVSFSVRPGQILGLIGPNGAGKTTVIDAITGFVKPSRGSVRIDDVPMDRLLVHARARLGVSRSFQSLELFEDISVRENILAATDDHRAARMVTDLVVPGPAILPPRAVTAVRIFELEADLEKLPSELSYGRRRLVAIARAVAAAPSILLLDEPAAGLDEDESAELAALVRKLAEEWGVGVLLIEHDMQFVMGTCDEIVVLEFGRTIATGDPDHVRTHPDVLRAYLGEDDTTSSEPVTEGVQK